MDISENKIVKFDQYCKTCAYKETPESEDPCNECLNNPVNLYSHKPVKWKEKTKGKQNGRNETSRSGDSQKRIFRSKSSL